ncbi:hypothetical protein OPV22_015002 [Ensete ventricosum]|uniref:Ribosome biogenesis protein NOP53 n=1 Tax=Ensete ventricosum TaxID=4639 RepID=A0AAV8R797_ENSVE|nr:hypothetical protein OPV22_015002 [Ensete ventricosum]
MKKRTRTKCILDFIFRRQVAVCRWNLMLCRSNTLRSSGLAFKRHRARSGLALTFGPRLFLGASPQLLRPPLLLLRSHSKRAAKRERIRKRWARRRRDRERGRRHGGPTSAPTTSARARSGLARTAAIASLPSDSLFNLDKISTTEIPAKRKIEKHKDKILHYESLLQKNPFVQPVPSSTLKKLKRKKKKVDIEKAQTQNASKADDTFSTLTDIWDNEGMTFSFLLPKFLIFQKHKACLIPAVEVELPGCSFNPPLEAHQDSSGKVVAEDNKYFLEADDGNESEIEEETDNDTNELPGQRKSKTKRVTRVELNRRARHKEQLKAEAAAKEMKNLSKEIDRQERLKSAPPRLGKYKFEPTPLQVLLTEEISGSLLKLKGCCKLTRDRFKSLERRGLLVPQAKSIRWDSHCFSFGLFACFCNSCG